MFAEEVMGGGCVGRRGDAGPAPLGTSLAIEPSLPSVVAKSKLFSEDNQEYGPRDDVMSCRS